MIGSVHGCMSCPAVVKPWGSHSLTPSHQQPQLHTKSPLQRHGSVHPMPQGRLQRRKNSNDNVFQVVRNVDDAEAGFSDKKRKHITESTGNQDSFLDQTSRYRKSTHSLKLESTNIYRETFLAENSKAIDDSNRSRSITFQSATYKNSCDLHNCTHEVVCAEKEPIQAAGLQHDVYIGQDHSNSFNLFTKFLSDNVLENETQNQDGQASVKESNLFYKSLGSTQFHDSFKLEHDLSQADARTIVSGQSGGNRIRLATIPRKQENRTQDVTKMVKKKKKRSLLENHKALSEGFSSSQAKIFPDRKDITLPHNDLLTEVTTVGKKLIFKRTADRKTDILKTPLKMHISTDPESSDGENDYAPNKITACKSQPAPDVVCIQTIAGQRALPSHLSSGSFISQRQWSPPEMIHRDIEALSTAAANGDLVTVKHLLDKGIAVDTLNNFGRTAIQVMAHDSPDLAEILLKAGADPNRKDLGKAGVFSTLRTITHDVAASGYTNTLRCLLQYGADVNLQDSWGNTPLHLAAKGGHLKAVRLLRFGTSLYQPNQQGKTALQILEESKDTAIQQWVRLRKCKVSHLKTLCVLAVRKELGPHGLRCWRKHGPDFTVQQQILLQSQGMAPRLSTTSTNFSNKNSASCKPLKVRARGSAGASSLLGGLTRIQLVDFLTLQDLIPRRPSVDENTSLEVQNTSGTYSNDDMSFGTQIANSIMSDSGSLFETNLSYFDASNKSLEEDASVSSFDQSFQF